MPLKRIKQTSKTILFEEFNSSVPDLYTILTNEEESDYFEKIKSYLEVSSFGEFAEKFIPTVWEWTEVEINEYDEQQFRFRYSVEKPQKPNAKQIDLTKNEFYNMIMDLYNKKSASGENNISFDYSRVEKLLAPKETLEKAKRLRKSLDYNFEELNKLPESRKTDRTKRIKEINETRKEIVKQYKDNFLGCVRLALADTEQKLQLTAPKNSDTSETLENITIVPCLPRFTETGDIEYVQIEDSNVEQVQQIAGSSQQLLMQHISNDFEKYSGYDDDDGSKTFVKSMILSNYCGDNSIVAQSREVLIQNKNKYTIMYKNAQEEFISAISGVVEKILNIKIFFEHATVDGKKLKAPLIISNCKADILLEPEVLEKFKKYIKSTSIEPDVNKIWFSILPAIGDADFIDEESQSDSSLDDLDFDSEDSQSRCNIFGGQSLMSRDTAKQMIDILSENKIITFFNYKANEKTGFYKFNVEIIEQYKEKLENFKGNSYAVFTYPNFTILPKRETTIKVGEIMVNGIITNQYMDISGVYVDSSYVSAGMMVGIQNPEYLKSKNYKVDLDLPCVRFNIEDEDNRFKILSKLNRETTQKWAIGIEDEIGKDMFGFCFCGNLKYFEDKKVNHNYVYQARNMSGNCIHTTMLVDFVKQYIELEATSIGGENSYAEEDINKFIENSARYWMRDSENNDYANNILRKSEEIKFEDKMIKISIKENNKTVPLDVNIKVNEGE